MEEAQLCYTHFVLHCLSHTPVCWLRQAAPGHHQWLGKVGRIPKAWQNRLRWREKETEKGKGEREESKGGRKAAEE